MNFIKINDIRHKRTFGYVKLKFCRFLMKWHYRLYCLYDRYTHGEHITTQSHMCVYTGFWDRMDKQTRSPYTYKNFRKIEKLLERLRRE